jgi:hypothetical protein
MSKSSVNSPNGGSSLSPEAQKPEPIQASLSANENGAQHHITTPLEVVLNEVLGKETLTLKEELKTALHRAKAQLVEALRSEAQRIVEEALAEEVGALAQVQPASPMVQAAAPIGSSGTSDVASQAPQTPAVQAEQDAMYQGVVKLTLNSHNTPRQMVNFVAELCQNPALRLLRMEGNGAEKAPDVWLALREPMDLKTVLKGMKDVEAVGCFIRGDCRQRHQDPQCNAGPTLSDDHGRTN